MRCEIRQNCTWQWILHVEFMVKQSCSRRKGGAETANRCGFQVMARNSSKLYGKLPGKNNKHDGNATMRGNPGAVLVQGMELRRNLRAGTVSQTFPNCDCQPTQLPSNQHRAIRIIALVGNTVDVRVCGLIWNNLQTQPRDLIGYRGQDAITLLEFVLAIIG